ncbi:MAG: undecaprenyl-diphosphate phosphatase [bacterium]
MIFFKAAILGVVEGITEFLPISSTGHLIIVNRFINFTGNFANMFDIVIQVGAIIAVIIYFSKQLNPFGSRKSPAEKEATWDIWKKTLVGVIPAIIIGGALGHKVEELLFNPVTVAIALLIGGIILILIENRKRSGSKNSISDISYMTAITIGLIQCLALVPGVSRAGATIIGAMLLGSSRKVAAEFSFFLAIPTLIAASAYALIKDHMSLTHTEWGVLAIGFFVSFLVAWAVIALFMNFIRKHDFKLFGYYRIILGLMILGYFFIKR